MQPENNNPQARSNRPAPTPESSADTGLQGRLTDWVLTEFIPRYAKATLITAGVVAVVAVGTVFYGKHREAGFTNDNKELGPAYVYMSEDKLDSAKAVLTNYLKKDRVKIAAAKANLLLGKVNYQQGNYDEAISAYQKVGVSDEKLPLLASGALHGQAASYIQKKDYAKAISLLEDFVERFMRRSTDPKDKAKGEGEADLSPIVPNALWKLALCYRETNNIPKLKATAQKLKAAYPESKETWDAERLLAQYP